MIVYKDILTGSEMFSDSLKMEVIDDFFYQVKGKLINVDGGVDESKLGANKSQEEQEEDVEDAAVKVIDVVHNHKLEETDFGGKKEFLTIIKTYFKSLEKKLESDEAKAKFKEAGAAAMKTVIKNFGDCKFYIGEHHYEGENEGMPVIAMYKGEDQETPYFLFVKDGIIAEKF